MIGKLPRRGKKVHWKSLRAVTITNRWGEKQRQTERERATVQLSARITMELSKFASTEYA